MSNIQLPQQERLLRYEDRLLALITATFPKRLGVLDHGVSFLSDRIFSRKGTGDSGKKRYTKRREAKRLHRDEGERVNGKNSRE